MQYEHTSILVKIAGYYQITYKKAKTDSEFKNTEIN